MLRRYISIELDIKTPDTDIYEAVGRFDEVLNEAEINHYIVPDWDCGPFSQILLLILPEEFVLNNEYRQQLINGLSDAGIMSKDLEDQEITHFTNEELS